MARAERQRDRDNDTTELSDAEVLEKAEEIIDAFLLLMRSRLFSDGLNCIFDVTTLPTTKSTLVNAFRLVIATEVRQEYRIKLLKAGMMLSRFHDGIGPKIFLMPVPTTARGPVRPARTETERDSYCVRRFDRALSLIAPDAKRLSGLFESAMRIAERRAGYVEPFQTSRDGTYSWHVSH